MDLVILGSGTSYGVPMIGCKCAVCRSSDVRNRRTRASVLFQYGGRNVLVDSSIDLRFQLLAAGIDRLDAVLYTHGHADHLHGLDDLRAFSRQGPLDLYASAPTARIITESFRYVFDDAEQPSEVPRLRLHTLDGPTDLFGETFWPVELEHGRLPILGYRVHDIAYLTDCSGIPDRSLRMLGKLKLLVIGAVRFRPHPTHFSVDEALEIVTILRPERAYLTHISHDLDHETVLEMLPDNVELAYDGLRVTVE
jgi:phosphoribosyl 1,2-cyclic phosphate phosphodiesterase